MKQNFEQSLHYTLKSEGGYVNDPQDPGGATNKGITQSTYNAWRRQHNLPIQDVRIISDLEVEAIYHNRYWDPIVGDDLPSGLDYATFDFAVNSGTARAAMKLQTLVGAVADGHIGPMTLSRIRALPTPQLIDDLCSARQRFLEALPTFGRFGNGWTARVKEVRAQAKAMCNA